MRTELNVVYATKAGLPLEADFYLPDSSSPAPLVVFCHGGGWISGSRDMYEEEAVLMAQNGIAAATVSYRLAPLNPFPACVADLQDFVLFARAQADRFQIQPDRIVAIGNSAGGYLSAMLALCDKYFGEGEPQGPYKVDASVAICPITDLTAPRETHFPISWSFLEQFLGGLDAPEELLRLASPLHHVSPLDAPMLLLHGDQDDIVPVKQSHDLAAALKAVGANVELVILPHEMHSFTWPAWMGIREKMLHFVRHFTQVPAP